MVLTTIDLNFVLVTSSHINYTNVFTLLDWLVCVANLPNCEQAMLPTTFQKFKKSVISNIETRIYISHNLIFLYLQYTPIINCCALKRHSFRCRKYADDNDKESIKYVIFLLFFDFSLCKHHGLMCHIPMSFMCCTM